MFIFLPFTCPAGSDYVAEQTLGIVLSGSESFKFNVTIIDDSIQEIPNMENFTVSITLLDSTRPVITLDPSVAYVTIVDDDGTHILYSTACTCRMYLYNLTIRVS